MSKELSAISGVDLANVHGGDNKPGYNKQDLKDGLKGAAQGAVRGGPIGAAWGFGFGFMKRNVKELYDASKDLYKEYRRGKELDKKRMGG